MKETLTPSITKSASPSFLDGGGKMGELIRSFNWSHTPLGSPENWPQSLRTSLSIMLETHFPMYIAWGPEFIQFYNDGYRPILGSTKHPAIGKSTYETFSEIWEIIGPMFQGVMNGKAVGVYDFLLPLDRNGYLEECYFIFSYSPIRDESGGVGGVLVTVTETTERVINERRLKTLKNFADRAAETKTINQAFVHIDQTLTENPFDFPYGLYYHLDEKAQVLTLKSSLGKNQEGIMVPAEIDVSQKDSIHSAILNVLEKGKPQLVNSAFNQQQFLGGAWPEKSISHYLIPVKRPEKDALFGILVLGISPRKKFDEAYKDFFHLVADHAATAMANAVAFEEERKRNAALLEIDKAKTVFFSNISHEFRTPLTLMLSPIEEIFSDKNLPPSIKNRFEIFHRNATRLLKLVNTLLDFSRIEAGRMKPNFTFTDISTLTKNLASTFRSAIEKTGIQYEVLCEDIKKPVIIDVEMWEKIVLNLLSNAFKYTQQGKIVVRLYEQNQHIYFSVRDTGAGIPEEEQTKIFERFHRVENSMGRSQEGTGIGLALVQELVKIHHGEIKVNSVYGKGSEFIVCIPLQTNNEAKQIDAVPVRNIEVKKSNSFVEEALRWILPNKNDEQADTIELLPDLLPASSPVVKPGKYSVLIADDNADMRDYLKHLLHKEYKVHTVSNGSEVLKYLEQKQPDLIISDIMMPGIDGLNLVKKLKANASFSSIPVILLSARAGEEATVEGIQAGADDYLVKPFSAKELISRVNSTIRISKERYHTEQNLKNIFLQSPFAITILKGPDFIIELANEKALELWDKKKEEVLNKKAFDVFPELIEEGFPEILKNVYETGTSFISNENPIQLFRHGKIETVYINFVYEPFRNSEGQVIGIMGVGVEVTDQILAKKKIEDAEIHSRLAIEAADLGAYTINIKTGEIECNDRLLELFGFKKTDKISHEQLVETILPEFKKIREMAHTVSEKTGILHYEAKFKGPDEKIRWLKVRGKLYYDEQQQPEKLLGTVMDVTAQKELEQRKDDFIKMTSHELKTPITSIKGYIQLLLSMMKAENQKEISPSTIQTSLLTVDKQISKLTRLLSELLDLSKMETGKLELSKVEFDLNELVEETVADVRNTDAKHPIYIHHHTQKSICADRERIYQVLTNLLTNAIKYSPDLAPIDVTVFQPSENEISVSIKDRGIGIDPKEQRKIFDRFYRVEGMNEKTYPGFGIGLFIANEIITRHNGHIMVESEKGKGSVFTMSIPLKIYS